MSLFSGDCQELAPCAVPVHQLGNIRSYGSTTSTTTTTTSTTAALVHPSQIGRSPNNENVGEAGTQNDNCKKEEKRVETDEQEARNGGERGEEPIIPDNQDENDETKITPAPSSVTRVFKKCASNGSLALYVGTRTVTIDGTHLEPLKGIIVLDKESLQQTVSENFRIWGQITLTFRYGREDEEVLGLRFCNEAILALKQLWPPLPRDPEDEFSMEDELLTPLQGVLLDRVNCSANSPSIHSVPFTLCAGPVGIGAFPPPPSVLLAPAKPYKGSPIGTLYDLRIYAAERPEERPPRRNTIRLALRAVQTPPQQVNLDLHGFIESRPTILSRGKIRLHIELNTNAVRYGEPLEVNLTIQNNSRSSIRRLLVSLIQQVDVCMFTSGKFKNIVGYAEDNLLLVPGASYQKQYNLTPQRGPARQWLALEEAFGREPVLAPSTVTEGLEPIVDLGPQKGSNANNRSRNVFAIIVSYYVKAKLILGGLSLCQSLKVPFVLLPPLNSDDPDPYPCETSTGCAGVDGGVGGTNLNPENIVTTDYGGGTDAEHAEPLSSVKVTDSESGAGGDKGLSTTGSTYISGGGGGGDSCDKSDTQRTGASESSKSRLPPSSRNEGGGGGGTISPTSFSTSSTGGSAPQAVMQHHQPQIHHQHLAATPSPVRVPSAEHLF